MLQVGDLIQWRDERIWIVRKLDPQLGTALVESTTANEIAILDLGAEEDGACKVVCNPARDWPSLQLPQKRPGMRLVGVRVGDRSLAKFVDWVRLDELQVGGLVYLSPELGLRYRDRLVAVFSVLGPSGPSVTECSRLEIPRNFISQGERQAELASRPTKAPSAPQTLFDHVLDDDA